MRSPGKLPVTRWIRLATLAMATVVTVTAVLVAPSWTAQAGETLRAALPSRATDRAPGPPRPPRPAPVNGRDLSRAQGPLEMAAALHGVDAPDPFLLVHDGQPWLFTTNTIAGNVPVIRPADGDGTSVVDALPVLPSWAEPGYTWAPAVTLQGNRWVLAFTARDRASGRQCIGVASALTVAGPYLPAPTPLVCDVARGGSIDPSFVVDDAGNNWLLYKDDGNCCGMPTALRAAPLTADGTALAGPAVVLLHANQPWEDGVVEAPTMVQVDDRWLLLYSASRWDHAGYAVGAAWCTTPVGPCVKQDGPALSVGAGYDGPGGLEFVAGVGPGDSLPVVFHAWPDGPHGYDDGSVRELHAGLVATAGDQVTIRSVYANAGQ